MLTELRSPSRVPIGVAAGDAARARRALVVLAVATAGLCALFLTYDVQGSWSYALELRSRRLAGLVLVASCLGPATVLFHTITHNRILTPNLIGFDSLYVLIQTSAAFVFGTFAFLRFDIRLRFGIELAVMLVFALVLQRWLLARNGHDLYLLVLVGIILGATFSGLTALVSRMIDPNEFVTLQDRLFASFSTVDRELVTVSAAATVALLALAWRWSRLLDVVALGRDHCVSLGVDHDRLVERTMLCVAALVSVATALVGPVTFLGIIVANLAYRITGTFRHRTTLPAAALLGSVALVGGQFLLERVFRSTTRLSMIIGFVGGLAFIVLLVRGDDR